MSFRQHSFQLGIDWREPAVVTHLKNPIAAFDGFEHATRIGNTSGHRFFAKDVFAFFGGQDREFGMLGVGRSDVDNVASREHFGDAVRDSCTHGLSQPFSSLFIHIVDRGDLNAIIARQNRSVHSGDITCAEETYFEFGHRGLSADYADYTEKFLGFWSWAFGLCLFCLLLTAFCLLIFQSADHSLKTFSTAAFASRASAKGSRSQYSGRNSSKLA